MANQATGTMSAQSRPAHSIIAADQVVGTEVYNSAGEHLGEIHDIILDKESGHVVYAVMSFGGFLSIGEKYHPLPWSVLKYDTERGGYVVPLTRDRLENAPMYDRAGEPDWSDRTYGKRIYDYYGTSPYWM